MNSNSHVHLDRGHDLPPVTSTLTRTLLSFRSRLTNAWKRYQYRRVKIAIRTYSPEKHFLTGGFHPVVGQATMRMVRKEIERNKFPFHADQNRPWLQEKRNRRPQHPQLLNGGPENGGLAPHDPSPGFAESPFLRRPEANADQDATTRIILIPKVSD